jgi:hypothetical protein
MTLDATTTIAMSNPLNFDSGTLYIDAANNRVGIGTTTPDVPLHVIGDIYTGEHYIKDSNARFRLYDTDSSDDAADYFEFSYHENIGYMTRRDDSGANTWNYMTMADGYTALYADDAEVMRLDNGNVGIGTTSPGAKLHVTGGNIKIDNGRDLRSETSGGIVQAIMNLYTDDNLYFGGGNAGINNMIFRVDGSERVRIDSSGNVGIGTSSPSYKFHVNSTSTATETLAFFENEIDADNEYNIIGIGREASTGNAGIFGYRYDTTADKETAFISIWGDNPSAGTGLHVQKGGNVGIGTTGPGYKLDVAGDLGVNYGGMDIKDYGGMTSGTDYFIFKTESMGNGSSASARIILTSTGVISSKEIQVNIKNAGGTNYVYVTPLIGDRADIPFDIKYTNQVGNAGVTEFYITPTQNLSYSQSVTVIGEGILFDSSGLDPGTKTTVDLSSGILVDSAGNVGIGTTGPVSKLEIEGGKTTIDSTDSSYGQFQIGNSASGGEVSMAWISGVTGYGSPPTSVNGDSYIWVTGANIWGIGGNKWGIGNKGLSGNLAVTVQSNGNVGIGTTSPTYPLHVFRTGDGIVAGFRDDTGTCTINPNTTSLSCSSDVRMKTEIETIEGALDKILGIRGVNFKWINQNDDKNHIGVIAQEAEGILPELVSEDAEGYKTVGYAMFTPVLIEAIKEQQKQIEDLKLALNELGLVEGESMEHGTLTPEQSSAQGTAHSIEQGGETGILESIKTALATLSGQVKAAGEWIFDKITTRHLAIDTSEKENEDPTIGEGKISEMEQEVKIYNRNLKKSSKIFVSFNSNLGGRSWYVAEKHAIPGDDPANNYFIIRLSSAINHDVDFDYWIVQVAKGDQHETDTELLDTEQTQNTEHGTTATTSSSSTLGVFPPNGSSTPSVSPNEDTTATSTEVTNATTTEPIISSAEATTTQATTTQETTHDMEHETEDMKQKTWNMEQEAEETEEDLIDKAIDVLKKGEKEQEMIDNLKKELGETSEEESVEEPVETIEILEEIDFSNVTSSTL